MRESPSTVADLMIPVPTPIPGAATVGEAIDLIRAHDHGGLPVVDGARLVGFVTPIHLLRQPLYRTVAEVMATDLSPARPDLSIGQAYELLMRQRADVLPVVEGGRLVGLITLAAVLEARSQERDPLTGLPWATALRTWATSALEGGREVAVLFIDLDNFRIINKALGHVVGDDIIRSVAYLLASQIDPATDLLCRYAGDEFAVATTRGSEDARGLAQRLRDAVNLPVEIQGREERVTVAIGFAGGRRVEPRTAAHIASTVEDLLTLASRGSTLAKESGRGIVHYSRREEDAAPRDGGADQRSDEVRLRLVRASVNRDVQGSTAVVELSLRGRAVRGTASARILGHGAPFLVAEATLRAITQAVGESPGYLLDDLTLTPSEQDTVAVAVLISAADPSERLVGSAGAPDPHTAVSRAILSALNRRLGKALAGVL
ncbi:MAG TPA: GGDEF domain-containing protein [bacterium]|nr:GGDEF domain-containing protein [bacterium]